MPSDAKTPWFLRPLAVLIALLCAGPLGLPLVWMSPALRRWHKWCITVLIAILTVWLFRASADLCRILLKDMQALQDAMR